jgi:hypothetical protein
MDTALIVAVISAAVALASAGLSTWSQMKVKSIEQEARTEETRSKERLALDRYRGPLLDAAWDLGERLDNIVDRSFFSAYNTGARQSMAIASTLFRLAQYFGWVEIVRREVQLLRFDSAADTWRTAYLLSLVTRRFATDWYSSTDAQDQANRWIGHDDAEVPEALLMLWQEEQRGIGERMIVTDGTARCIGYATFLDSYQQSFTRLLAEFESGLRLPSAAKSLRLIEVRDALARLVHQLDEEKRYEVSQIRYRTWLDSAHDSPCWARYEHPTDAMSTEGLPHARIAE